MVLMEVLEVLPQKQWTRYSCYDVNWKTSKNFPRLDVEDLQVSVHHRKSQVGQHCVEMCSKVKKHRGLKGAKTKNFLVEASPATL